MIDRRKRRLDSVDRLDGRSRGASDHHHLDAQHAGRLDLRIGGVTAAVLGDDNVDMMLLQQRTFAFPSERATIEDVVDIRQCQRRFDGIDTADEIGVLRRHFRMMRALPAGREEDAARGGAKRRNGSRNAFHLSPAITLMALPFGTAQSNGSNAGGISRKNGICRNPLGEGVGSVDQQVISTGLQEIGKRGSAAETTDANRNRLRGRFFGAAGKRQQNIAIITHRERLGQEARLAGAAEDQDAGSSHV